MADGVNIDVGNMIREAVQAAGDLATPELVELIEPGSGAKAPAYKTRDGIKPVDQALFAQYRDKPKRRTGTARLSTLQSLIDHANRFKSADSAIFADDDPETPALRCVLDYHPSGATSDPAFGTHVGHYGFPLSAEWRAWAAMDGKAMDMVDFAAFLESNLADIEAIESADVLPEAVRGFVNTIGYSGLASPSRLLELSRNLVVHENSRIGEARNLSSGESSIMMTSEHTDGAGNALNIPGAFVLCVRVFEHDAYYRMLARLRYRKSGGLKFFYQLWRPDLIFSDAVRIAAEKVAAATELPLFYGAPE